MPHHTPDHSERDHQHDGDGAEYPRRPARSALQDTWRVERIVTEPMTAQQYDLAVTTLATLIAQWLTNQESAI